MNKTVLITGASKGIGLATCQRLAKHGWTVIGLARSTAEGFPGYLFQCDLGDRVETKEVLEAISKQHAITSIVNNVGLALPEALGEIDLDSLDQVYDLNVRAAVQVTQHFLPTMKANKYGRIVNISSRAAFRSKAKLTSYSAAKCALIGCTKTWALELAQTGITVNAVAPGPVETELFRQGQPVGSEAEKRSLATIPMGRFGEPDEIAAGIEFLLSRDASFITGHTLCIDGGGAL